MGFGVRTRLGERLGLGPLFPSRWRRGGSAGGRVVSVPALFVRFQAARFWTDLGWQRRRLGVQPPFPLWPWTATRLGERSCSPPTVVLGHRLLCARGAVGVPLFVDSISTCTVASLRLVLKFRHEWLGHGNKSPQSLENFGCKSLKKKEVFLFLKKKMSNRFHFGNSCSDAFSRSCQQTPIATWGRSSQ